jgi:hypothetical protein
MKGVFQSNRASLKNPSRDRSTRTVFYPTRTLSPATAATAATESPMTLNQKVVVWAQGQLGKKVGAGECWDLGESALKQAGAQTSNDLGPLSIDESRS